jgi:hypothetical protein
MLQAEDGDAAVRMDHVYMLDTKMNTPVRKWNEYGLHDDRLYDIALTVL